MSKKKNVTFASFDDWEGMYIDGKLVLEGHSLDKEAVLTELGIEYSTICPSEEYMDRKGSLPERLTEVPHAGEDDCNPCYCKVCKPNGW